MPKTSAVTVKAFRAELARYLRDAARDGAPLHVGEYVMTVRRADEAEAGEIAGCMRGRFRIREGADLDKTRLPWGSRRLTLR